MKMNERENRKKYIKNFPLMSKFQFIALKAL